MIIVDKRDCETIEAFCIEFNVDAPKPLKDAIDAYKEQDNYDNQRILQKELCKWLVSSKNGHEIWNNPAWEKFKDNAAVIAYNLEFDMDLEETLKGVPF